MDVTTRMEVASELEMSGLTMLKEGVTIALGSINANKVRSGLTILGVAIGVGVVVMLAALITGIRTSGQLRDHALRFFSRARLDREWT